MSYCRCGHQLQDHHVMSDDAPTSCRVVDCPCTQFVFASALAKQAAREAQLATRPEQQRRDRFAAAALQGLLSSPARWPSPIGEECVRSFAELSVSYADALIAALDKVTPAVPDYIEIADRVPDDCPECRLQGQQCETCRLKTRIASLQQAAPADPLTPQERQFLSDCCVSGNLFYSTGMDVKLRELVRKLLHGKAATPAAGLGAYRACSDCANFKTKSYEEPCSSCGRDRPNFENKP